MFKKSNLGQIVRRIAGFAVTGIVVLGAFSSVGHVAHAGSKSKDPLQTVPALDVDRYLGLWYEVARLPQIFQPFCTGVTAEYTANPDGSVKVVNRCRIADPTYGLPISIRGKAYPVDGTNSKLKVEFFGGLSVGDYWVLELDEDYKWAVVGDPNRFSLYILSREPVLDDATYQRLLDLVVTKHGYDISRLIKTRQ